MKVDYLKSLLRNAGDEPDRIQQLRKLIVALAVSGKLGANKRSYDLPRVSPDALPEHFEEASGFTVLSAIARIEKGRTGIKQAVPGPYPLVVTAAERSSCDHFDFEGPAAIVPLVSSTGHGKASLHRLHYQEGNFALGTILAAIFPFDVELISARFLFEYLSAFKEELLVSRMIGTANVSLSVGKIAEVPVPLVSLDVQTKVDELMALCDQLEAARTEREALRDRLAAASLARLNTPDPETFTTDARFALDALASLTARADQIKQFRQTILNLAVRGKLESQQALGGERRSACSGPYELPAGWRWLPTKDVCEEIIDCPHSTAKFEPTGVACVDTNSFKGGRLLPSKLRFVSEETYAIRIARLKPLAGDVVFAREGSVGESVIIPERLRCCLGQRVMLFRPGPNVTSKYFQLAISEPSAVERLVSMHKGIGAKHVNVKDMRNALLPVPPLPEQHRIVAKVDELMALCDQLVASLATADDTRRRLLDALLHEALAPVAKPSKEHARAAVSGYLVSRLASKRNFGRTAHMKHLYFAESLLGLNLGGRYMREAAGPLDTGIYELEKRAEAAGWYTQSVETLPSGNEKVSYQPGKALKAIAEEGITVLGRSRAEMDRLIDLMGDFKTEPVEIIATLFAAWNDALLDGKTPDDNWIIKEVREHWHVSKQRFTPADLKKWLGWMRQNDVVPLGHAPRTMQQTTMEF